jgi:hypothetical protein
MATTASRPATEALLDVRTLGIDDDLDGEDARPGFRFPLSQSV